LIAEIREAGEEICDDFERRKGRTKAARSKGKTKSRPDSFLDFKMPNGTLLRNCTEAEFDVVKRFVDDKATIGDLDAAGPATALLARALALEVIRGVRW
jgi:hypothetical protein